MAAVRCQQIYKTFGAQSRAVEVLAGIDCVVEEGEFVSLLGPSGCGKSTLLRMIAGLETIDGGEVRIGTTVVNDVPPKARNIAMVFDTYLLGAKKQRFSQSV